MREYSFHIDVERVPPMGRLQWVARVAYLREITPSGERPVTIKFPERWGATEDEAREKLCASVQSWIDSMVEADAQ